MPRELGQAIDEISIRSLMPSEVEKRLFGLGPFRLQLDRCRITAPYCVRERLGHFCRRFVLSIWHGPSLRIVPEVLWIPYLELVRTRISDAASAATVISNLRQTCHVQSLDHHSRWNVPTEMASRAGLICEHGSIVLLPNQFWVEVLSEKRWEEFVSQTLQLARGTAGRELANG